MFQQVFCTSACRVFPVKLLCTSFKCIYDLIVSKALLTQAFKNSSLKWVNPYILLLLPRNVKLSFHRIYYMYIYIRSLDQVKTIGYVNCIYFHFSQQLVVKYYFPYNYHTLYSVFTCQKLLPANRMPHRQNNSRRTQMRDEKLYL